MGKNSLKDEAAAVVLLAALGTRQQCSPCSVLEHFADTFASLGRALEVVLGTNLLCNSHTLR